jgi:prepilin-type N-terminal cleavage/methylation domain-containing protein
VKKLKKLKSKFNVGFTMIELLIVIAVLGVLAIAVLATINPIEQINRGRDTGSRSDSEQLLSAIDRYNATASKGLWPWQTIQDPDTETVAWGPVVEVEDDAGCSVLDKLAQGETDPDCDPETSADEIKAAFVTRLSGANYNSLYLEYVSDPGNSVYVCFSPQSKAFTKEAQERCEDVDNLPTDYPASACNGDCADIGAGNSEWCICLP